MFRLLRILFVALLMGPQVGTALVPSEYFCQESRDCCPPDSDCDRDCVACASCAGGSSGFISSSVAVEFADARPDPAHAPASAIVLPLLSTDILHVPKSV